MHTTPSRLRAAALLAAVPAAALTATPSAHAAPLNSAITGTTFGFTGVEGTDLSYGVLLDLDGDGVDDFELRYESAFGLPDYGDQLRLSPLLPIPTAQALVGPGVNSVLVDLEGASTSAAGGTVVAAFDAAGKSLTFPDVTSAQILDEQYDEDGSFTIDAGPTGGSFTPGQLIDSVLYDSLTYDLAVQDGSSVVVVFDIPGGSPYAATLDIDAAFNENGSLSTLTFGAGSSFVPLAQAVPEPASAALVGLGALAMVRRRR